MADNSPPNWNVPTAREISLAFKASTEGLTDAEEQELSELRVKRKLKQSGIIN